MFLKQFLWLLSPRSLITEE